MPFLRARSLAYYWRTNAAVALGVAVAASVLAGALLVGDSVRASLRELVLSRLGRADVAVLSPRFFRATLAEALAPGPRFAAACPLVALDGLVTHEASGRRAARVAVYGVDERFVRFHGRADLAPPEGSEALLSPALASELGAAAGDVLIVRVEPPAAISAASLFGRRDDRGRALRVTAKAVRAASDLGEFSLRPQQQAVRALFVPLGLMERALKQPGRVNTILLAGPGSEGEAGARLAASLSLEDLGLRLRVLPDRGALSLESESALLDDDVVKAARGAAEGLGLRVEPVLSYLAVGIRAGERTIPYSLVAALGPDALEALGGGSRLAGDALLLNDWAARDLSAQNGEVISIDYLSWEERGRLVGRTADFRLAGVVPLTGAAADRDLVPEYPGITDSLRLSGWDPPFPVDLGRIGPHDEEYWKRYRTTPKAFLPLARGQELFGHRLGKLTSLRLHPPAERDLQTVRRRYEDALRRALDPAKMGFAIDPARARGLAAARGSTDFGEYFAYFSAFLVGAALLLAGLFFRLGVEQRLREVGLLRALGFSASRVRAQFLGEGLVLAGLGALLGLLGAAAYAGLMLLGLRTFWVDAVGTEALRLHLSVAPLVWGVAGALLSALLVTALTLRGLEDVPARRLLSGVRDSLERQASQEQLVRSAGVAAIAGAGLLITLSLGGVLGDVAGFFGAGLLLLAGFLCFEWRWLSARRRAFWGSAGWAGLLRLGFRGASHRPGRSLLSIALIASACFVIVAVSAFRRAGEGPGGKTSGTGGYALVAESLLALHHDLETSEGRAALGLTGAKGDPLAGVSFTRFRVRPGDDASCLSLYRPQSPRILAPARGFVEAGRFAFQSSLARTTEDEANPWRLLEREVENGAIPVIADANSLTYGLHRKLGDEIVIDPGGRSLRLRFVGALRDSVLQGELLMAEKHFLRLFPEEEGYRFFLIDTPPSSASAVATFLESRLADLGFDAMPVAERLAGFHRVENTYLSTFQTLGGLGLLLGTVGLATVLIRNALERRRELALLRAVGYRPGHLALLVLAENALLLVVGLATGTLSALLAIVPAVWSRGGQVPFPALAALLLAVLLTGIVVSALAVRALNRSPLLQALRAE